MLFLLSVFAECAVKRSRAASAGGFSEITVDTDLLTEWTPKLQSWLKTLYPSDSTPIDTVLKIEKAWKQVIAGYKLKLIVSWGSIKKEIVITHLQPWTGTQPELTSIKDVSTNSLLGGWKEVEGEEEKNFVLQQLQMKVNALGRATISPVTIKKQIVSGIHYHVVVNAEFAGKKTLYSAYVWKQVDGTVTVNNVKSETVSE